MVHGSILANHIMCADLGLGDRESMERFRASILGCVMDDYKIGFPQIEIYCTDPGGILKRKIIDRFLPDRGAQIFSFLLIPFV